jgi:hypothetical protein
MYNITKEKQISVLLLVVQLREFSSVIFQSNVILTHRPPLLPGDISGIMSDKRLSRPQGQSASGRIKSMKTPKDPIGNRTRNLPPLAQSLNEFTLWAATMNGGAVWYTQLILLGV